jgi:hypothetical protein
MKWHYSRPQRKFWNFRSSCKRRNLQTSKRWCGDLLYNTKHRHDFKAGINSGRKIVYPKISNGELSFVAALEDTKGSRITLHQRLR